MTIKNENGNPKKKARWRILNKKNGNYPPACALSRRLLTAVRFPLPLVAVVLTLMADEGCETGMSETFISLIFIMSSDRNAGVTYFPLLPLLLSCKDEIVSKASFASVIGVPAEL